jgi:hypothetical protein
MGKTKDQMWETRKTMLALSRNDKVMTLLRRTPQYHETAVRRAAEALGLNAEDSADRSILLGFLALIVFPQQSALAGFIERKRGRPPKAVATVPLSDQSVETEPEPQKRGRGRPRDVRFVRGVASMLVPETSGNDWPGPKYWDRLAEAASAASGAEIAARLREIGPDLFGKKPRPGADDPLARKCNKILQMLRGDPVLWNKSLRDKFLDT